jgi:hypothetical protein
LPGAAGPAAHRPLVPPATSVSTTWTLVDVAPSTSTRRSPAGRRCRSRQPNRAGHVAVGMGGSSGEPGVAGAVLAHDAQRVLLRDVDDLLQTVVVQVGDGGAAHDVAADARGDREARHLRPVVAVGEQLVGRHGAVARAEDDVLGAVAVEVLERGRRTAPLVVGQHRRAVDQHAEGRGVVVAVAHLGAVGVPGERAAGEVVDDDLDPAVAVDVPHRRRRPDPHGPGGLGPAGHRRAVGVEGVQLGRGRRREFQAGSASRFARVTPMGVIPPLRLVIAEVCESLSPRTAPPVLGPTDLCRSHDDPEVVLGHRRRRSGCWSRRRAGERRVPTGTCLAKTAEAAPSTRTSRRR